jgi:hypothetical protein
LPLIAFPSPIKNPLKQSATNDEVTASARLTCQPLNAVALIAAKEAIMIRRPPDDLVNRRRQIVWGCGSPGSS